MEINAPQLGTPELSQVASVQSGVGQNTDLYASPLLVGILPFLTSVFSADATSSSLVLVPTQNAAAGRTVNQTLLVVVTDGFLYFASTRPSQLRVWLNVD